MSSPILDDELEEFRKAGHEAIDRIVALRQRIDSIPVLSDKPPGWVRSQFADEPSSAGKDYGALFEELERKILPGITHWNHPAFFAYFAITGSHAGIIGELLSAALNINGMLWKTSPAATELEELALDWLRKIVGLPEGLFGIINDTASINTFLALAAARESLGLDIRRKGLAGRSLPQMRIYCSEHAHSAVDKAAIALGFGLEGLTKIESDDAFRMRVDLLEEEIRKDRAAGVLPCAVLATVGTTSTAAIDPLPGIGAITSREALWLHVDAAYAGPAAIVPELRSMWDGIEYADSIVLNPHKWLFTPIDCSALYTRRREMLKETFSLVPEYLKTSEGDEVINYMDYGLQLGRRFRALKLWMVLEHYGVEKLRQVIRHHVALAKRLEESLMARSDIEMLAPQAFSVLVFRRVIRVGGEIDEPASEVATTELLERLNASGRLFVSHTRLRDRLGIRVAIGNGATEWRHVERILTILSES